MLTVIIQTLGIYVRCTLFNLNQTQSTSDYTSVYNNTTLSIFISQTLLSCVKIFNCRTPISFFRIIFYMLGHAQHMNVYTGATRYSNKCFRLGYVIDCMESSLRNSIVDTGIILKYEVPLCRLLNDILKLSHIQHPSLIRHYANARPNSEFHF